MKKNIKLNKKNAIIIGIIIIIIIVGVIISLCVKNNNEEKPVKVTLTESTNENANFKYSDIWKIKVINEFENGSGNIRLRLKDTKKEVGDVFIQYEKDFSDYYKNNSEFYKSMKATYSEKILDNGETVHTWELLDDDVIFRYDYKSTENGDIIVSSQFYKKDKGHVEQIIESITISNKITEEIEETTESTQEDVKNSEINSNNSEISK